MSTADAPQDGPHAEKPKPAVPLTVIGGFLGAGKTTLLNRLLADNAGVRYAVLVNDFGELAIDGDLVAAHDGETVTLANGCICCSMGDDLLASLIMLMQRAEPPEHIVVEASGVADPKPIADVGELHPGLRRDLVLVLADAQSLAARAADGRLADTVRRQLRAADLVALNKCDLADTAQREAARRLVVETAPRAAMVETERARLPLQALLAAAPAAGTGTGGRGHRGHAHQHEDSHDAVFRSCTLGRQRPFDRGALTAALQSLPGTVLRAKGFVRLAEAPQRPWLVQLCGRHLELTPWPGRHDAAGSRLVLIGTADMPEADWLAAHLGAETVTAAT